MKDSNDDKGIFKYPNGLERESNIGRGYLKGRYFREKIFSRKIFSRIDAP